MCNCLINLKKNLLKDITELSTEKDFKILEGDFLNRALTFDPSDVKIYLEFKYISTFTRANGETSKPKSKTVNIFPTYCPFCGKEYKKKKKEPTQKNKKS